MNTDAMRDEITAMTDDDLHEEMQVCLRGNPWQKWRYITSIDPDIGHIYDVAYHADRRIESATTEADVLRSLVLANRKLKLRRSASAKKAARTRAIRREKKIYQIVQRATFYPAKRCEVCNKKLTDEKAIARGIGSECWNDILKRMQDELTKEVTHNET